MWARASDDRLVVLGANGNDSGNYLARLRRSGSIDRGFGKSGLVVGTFAENIARDLEVQPSGRILVLGDTDTGSRVSALRSDGSRARGFGHNGQVRIDLNYPGDGSLLSRPDGTILVVGRPNRIIGSKPDPKLIIHGLLPDGSPDRDFGRDGRAAMPIAFPHAEVQTDAATVLRDGSIVVSGQIGVFSSDAYVARFTADGQPDRTFGGGDGWRRYDIGRIDRSITIAELARSRFAVVGGVQSTIIGPPPPGGGADAFVAVFRRDGRFRERFGDGGVVRDDFGNDSAVANDAAVVDGGLVVVGGSDGDMFAARYRLGRR